MPETYPQDIDGFEARLGWTGWPEHAEGPRKYRQRQIPPSHGYTQWVREFSTGTGWTFDGYLTGHEAACLIRNGNRECLEKYANERSWDCLHLSDGCEYYIQMRDLETGEMKLEICKPNIDAAQAAAIDAVMGEGEQEKGNEKSNH